MEISFSIIIPLYNKAPYIERAVKSVLSQDYPHFEIIIVNDGSSDGGEKIVTTIVDERLKLVSQKNAGVSAARNKGAKAAKYPYIAFLDGDDTWEKDFLLEMKNLILEYPDAGMYGSNNYFIYPGGKKVKEDFSTLFEGKKTGIIKDYFGLFANIGKSPFSNSNICIPKKVYDEFNGYKVGVRLTEDSDLWCRIALKYKVAFNIIPLANYYLALSGSTHSIFEPEEYQVAKSLKLAIENNLVPIELLQSARKLIVFQKMSLVKRALIVGNKKFAMSQIFDKEIILHYPKEFFECLILLILPLELINKIRLLKHQKN